MSRKTNLERLLVAGSTSLAVAGCGGGGSGGSNNSNDSNSEPNPDVLDVSEVENYVISRLSEAEVGSVDDVILEEGVSNTGNDIIEKTCQVYGEHEGVSSTGNDYTLGVCFTSAESEVGEDDIYSPVASKRIDVIAPLIDEPTQEELTEWVDKVKISKPSLVYGVDEGKTLEEQYEKSGIYGDFEELDLKVPYRTFNGEPTSAEYRVFNSLGDLVNQGNLSINNRYVEGSVDLDFILRGEQYLAQVKVYDIENKATSVNVEEFQQSGGSGF